MERRGFLSGMIVLLAGCSNRSSQGESPDDSQTPTPTPTTERPPPQTTTQEEQVRTESATSTASATESPTPTPTDTAIETPTATETPTPSPTPTGTPRPKIGILEDEWTVINEPDRYGVTGIGRNNADAEMDIRLTVKFFDAEGVQLSYSNDAARYVSPDTKFRFEAPYREDDPDNVDSYEIEIESYES